MNDQGFEGLKVWQKAHQLMIDIHQQLVPMIPSSEKYDLSSQIKRSSKSVGANIAEGYGRFYYLDNVRFCYNARGSLDETVNHFRTAHDLDYCSTELYENLRQQASEIRRLLNGYITWLKNQKLGEKEPGFHVAIRENTTGYFLDDENE